MYLDICLNYAGFQYYEVARVPTVCADQLKRYLSRKVFVSQSGSSTEKQQVNQNTLLGLARERDKNLWIASGVALTTPLVLCRFLQCSDVLLRSSSRTLSVTSSSSSCSPSPPSAWRRSSTNKAKFATVLHVKFQAVFGFELSFCLVLFSPALLLARSDSTRHSGCHSPPLISGQLGQY